MENKLFRSIDGNYIKEPVAYCKFHKGHLTLKQMKLHRCMSRGCTRLKKIDGPYWEEHKRRKDAAKQRKKEQN